MVHRFVFYARRVPWRLVRAGAAIGALIAAQLVFVVAPVGAAGPSLMVSADQPAAVPKGHFWSFDDFFPRSLTVAQGTTIGFAIEGFHTATLLPSGTTVAQDQATSPSLAPDADDTAPNPNGSTHTNFVLPVLLPIPATGCGAPANPCTFDGTSVVSSGAPLAGPPSGPFVVTISAAPGTYWFHCRIHPLMNGALTVVASGASATTPAQLSAAVSTQVATDVQAGRVAEAKANAAGVHHNADGSTTWTLTAGTSSPDGRTVVLEMLPEKVTIRPGDTVTWIPRGSDEVHTVTFPTDIHTDFVAFCENGATDTPAIPSVVPPTGPQDFKCGANPADEVEGGPGNGVSTISTPTTVSDSGIIAPAGFASSAGLSDSAFPTSWTAHFTGAAAGTYTYVCQIHGPQMSGKITVLAAAQATPPATDVQHSGTKGGSTPVAPLLTALAALAIGTLGAAKLIARLIQ